MTDKPAPQLPAAPRRSWLRRNWAILFFVVLIGGDMLSMLSSQWLSAWQAALFARDCQRAISWVKTSHPTPGVHPKLALPDQFHRLQDRGEWDAVVLSDGRIALLLKETAGERDQRQGLILTSAPLKPAEIGRDSQGRQQIKIVGLPRHHIADKIDDRQYRVFLDPDSPSPQTQALTAR
jgi:hypothetical protein